MSETGEEYLPDMNGFRLTYTFAEKAELLHVKTLEDDIQNLFVALRSSFHHLAEFAGALRRRRTLAKESGNFCGVYFGTTFTENFMMLTSMLSNVLDKFFCELYGEDKS